LGLRTIAEGVETVEQRDALLALGCEFGQGYYWSPPLSAPSARTWIAEHDASAVTRAAPS
jgi:EAL domain-containing protein (putative c-di-GMP-specific phosphodiesterase class I)